MLIKNNAPRLRYIGGNAIAPGETKEVPDHWVNALKFEIESGECEVIEKKKQYSQDVSISQVAEDDLSEELQVEKQKRGRRPKVAE